MKYYTTLPLTALIAFCTVVLLVSYEIIPSGMEVLTHMQSSKFGDYFYLLIMAIILLESIVYVGFYFPGQFFAVVMVIGSQPRLEDVIYLTLAMVFAATLGSIINYSLGFVNSHKYEKSKPTQLKHLLLAMIHMNSLAFFMFSQGANHRSLKIVFFAGLINLPYYLALIAATALLSEEVMQIAENTLLLFILLGIWLSIALSLDIKKFKTNKNSVSTQ